MTARYIHICYRILDPEKSADYYVNKLGMKKVGETDLGSATNHFFAVEEDPSSPMLGLTDNRDRTDPYGKGRRLLARRLHGGRPGGHGGEVRGGGGEGDA